MKTNYKSSFNKHLSRDEIIRLVKNTLTISERDNAMLHLKNCELCSEAFEGLKQLPDLSTLHSMSAQWKMKTGVKPASKTLQVNLNTLYILLILTGLISIAIIYFFFFNPDKRNKNIKKENITATAVLPSIKNEHFVIDQNQNAADSGSVTPSKKIEPKITEGTYDNVKKPDAPLEKIEPLTAEKEIPQATLDVIKGISEQKLLNIEGFKIIDYSAEYAQKEKDLNSFSKGVEARYESEKHLNENASLENKNTTTVSYEDLIASALRSYKNGKYDAALSDFNFILNYFTNDLNCKFYKALCYKDAALYLNAIDQLKPLATNNTHTFYQEAKWHLALCYDLTGDKTASKNLLKEIVAENGFYKSQAINLLNKN